jgi:hypothetical protein
MCYEGFRGDMVGYYGTIEWMDGTEDGWVRIEGQ